MPGLLQPRVTREQRNSQDVGQRNVSRPVDARVLAKLPYLGQEWAVDEPLHRSHANVSHNLHSLRLQEIPLGDQP
jgi:hypothetical protein